MTTGGSPVDADDLVRDYLGRLEAAALVLGRDRREELVGEVREHINAALAEAGRSDDVTVRHVIERLGSPEEIVAAEAGQAGTPGGAALAPGAGISEKWGAVEVAAVVLLCLAGPAQFLPFGPFLWLGLGVIGLALVWASGVWPRRRKLVASTCVIALNVLLVMLTTRLIV